MRLLCILLAGMIAGCSEKHTFRLTDNGQTTEVSAYFYRIADVKAAQRLGEYPSGFFTAYKMAVFECDTPFGSDVQYYILTDNWQIRDMGRDTL